MLLPPNYSLISTVILTGWCAAQVYLEVNRRETEVQQRRSAWRRDWIDRYNRCKVIRDAITSELKPAHIHPSILPVFMGNSFIEKDCKNPSLVKDSDRHTCQLLQEFRNLGRSMMDMADLDQVETDPEYMRKQGLWEAANILLSTMALDAANGFAHLPSEFWPKNAGSEENETRTLSGLGEIFFLLYKLEDECNLKVLRQPWAEKLQVSPIPETITLALEKGREFANDVHGSSERDEYRKFLSGFPK